MLTPIHADGGSGGVGVAEESGGHAHSREELSSSINKRYDVYMYTHVPIPIQAAHMYMCVATIPTYTTNSPTSKTVTKQPSKTHLTGHALPVTEISPYAVSLIKPLPVYNGEECMYVYLLQYNIPPCVRN